MLFSFMQTVQSQQRAERDAAIARLEQSRITLALRLAEFHGRKYKVIQEAMDFVGHVSDDGRFTPPDSLHQIKRPNATISLLKKLLGLGNAALFTVSMLLLMSMQQVSVKKGSLREEGFENRDSFGDRNQPLDVFSGRG